MPEEIKLSDGLAAIMQGYENMRDELNQEPGEGWYSAKDMAAQWGITPKAAKNRLDAMHQRGVLERREFLLNGARPHYYRAKSLTP